MFAVIKAALKYSYNHEFKLSKVLKQIAKNNLKHKNMNEKIIKEITKILLDYTVRTQNLYKKFDLEKDGKKHEVIIKEQIEEIKKWQLKQLDWIESKGHSEIRKKVLRQAELKARNVKGNLYASFLKEIVSKDSDYFVWETVGDDRVRPEHQDRDQEIFSFKTADLLPGEEPLCRCWATIILKEEIN